MTKTILGVIGGSGVYDIPGLENPRWKSVKSPWGAPSDALLFGTYKGTDLVFLPRHGRGHVQTPSSINYRANIDVLKRVGVTDLISVSACGSLKEELPPGTFVIADQFIDRTFAREKSFFAPGFVAHVSMAHPVDPHIANTLSVACAEEGIAHARGGAYICIEGPQFSTLAESKLYRSWGCSVIGMTAMPEAKLAREAELPYGIVAMVTDFDCWHPDHDHVTVDAVVKVMHANADNARKLIVNIAGKLGPVHRPSPAIETVLDTAVMTAPDKRDPRLIRKLDAVAGRVLPKKPARKPAKPKVKKSRRR
ncbi:MAG TPA: S-methyl-5'-thioadenosine phosphorylase [Rhizomicrobium sp.]|jgi:5'-methylthioadenosine phosphorylase|nr:S-methyl-5'-thioadenosine phosphorylase [Rhizomicrobium sp.]